MSATPNKILSALDAISHRVFGQTRGLITSVKSCVLSLKPFTNVTMLAQRSVKLSRLTQK